HEATMPAEDAVAALERGERDRLSRAQETVFPSSTWRGDDLYLPEELSPLQMRFVAWCAKTDQSMSPMWQMAGLPNAPGGRPRRSAGPDRPAPPAHRARVTPPGGGAASWPLWRILPSVMPGQPASAAWPAAAAALDDDAMLALYDDATSLRYRLQDNRVIIDS